MDPSGLFDYNTILTYDPNHKNNDVLALQNELAYLGYLDESDRDGYFGQKTLDAVNSYKIDAGLWNFGEYEGVVGLTTWQSLGLIYREQGDIDRGVTIFTEAEGRQLYDVTKVVNDKLWSCGKMLEDKWIGDKQLTFYNKVKPEGDWDVKLRKSWDITFGGAYPGSGQSEVILNGEYSTPEQIGNIFYGYTGRAAGFAESTLYEASFVVAFPMNREELRGEYNDWGAIRKGVAWYDRN